MNTPTTPQISTAQATQKIAIATVLGLSALLTACGNNSTDTGSNTSANNVEILNVSYDVARDFYKEYNPLFIQHYKNIDPNVNLVIKQSHGGSSKQALSVKNGLAADVVTMNQGSDVELLADSRLVNANWRSAFKENAIPFTSAVVFLVRDGNPKNIADWGDLAKAGTEIVIANPKVSGNGRYAFLGAYGYGLHTFHQDKKQTQDFVKQLLGNVKVFENGGRAATTTFAQRGIGDVLITFENEANVIKNTLGNVAIVYPSYTINTENPVAVVQSVSDKKGTTAIANEYLNYLYSDTGQELAVKLYLRPSNAEILAKHVDKFPVMTTFFANDVFGDWQSIMNTYFKEGAIYDQLAINATNQNSP
ncbi:MAG: sulfate ABC transporter substrate-binding protein [Moraxella sp.]|nr:sulfate ABC transporter substrate-binding protein [Moraxella sp.]